jgi:hypothetical protein
VLLDLLEHPKFLTDAAFWELVLEQLYAAADPRLLGPFPALRSTVFARLSPVRLRDRVVRALDEIARETLAPRAPTAEEAALETTIASRLGRAIAKRDVEDKILDEIYETDRRRTASVTPSTVRARRSARRADHVAVRAPGQGSRRLAEGARALAAQEAHEGVARRARPRGVEHAEL